MLSAVTRARAVSRTWWVWAGIALLGYAAATFTIAEADLWGHLRFGLDLLRDRHLPSIDPYSFTQDRPWINHEWLSELVMAIAYRIGGVAGLVLLKGAMVFATFAIVWGALRDVHLGARAALMALMYVGTVHATSSFRPQVWTFLFVAVLVRVLAEDRSRRFLPLLFVVWVNAHGGWIVGLGVLAAWAGAEAFLDRRTAPRWAMVVAACVLATLVNPYGFGLWRFIRETVGFSRDIREWLPLFSNPIDVWAPWVIVTIGVIALASTPHRHRLAALAVSAMLAYASFRVMRISSLFLIAAIVALAPAIAHRLPVKLTSLPAPRPRGEGIAVALMFAASLACAAWAMQRTAACILITGSWAPSPVPVRMLMQAPAGRLVAYFDWGQYAIWHLGPRISVAIDGRRETVYSDARLADDRAIVAGGARGVARRAEWAPEY
ncbi:MAG TPA: hypothetical protein VFO19_04700, partial [Vicinamibacterales bacterium]|nr:hypothetical protein [Vicinamibacterales bacterium]